MNPLNVAIPDVDLLLSLEPEELGGALLKVAKASLNGNGAFHPSGLTAAYDHHNPPAAGAYPAHLQDAVERAVSEGLHWLEVQGLFVPQPGPNGAHGWRLISRRGYRLLDAGAFKTFQSATGLPKDMLHPRIAEKAWLDLARGDLEDAVFYAFRTVEEAVREAGGYALTDIGVPLMRKAFDVTNGRLTDTSQPEAEREALSHLFAGAIGSYKNPHSHRTVKIEDPREAQEMVLLASHLLRIVDSRKKP